MQQLIKSLFEVSLSSGGAILLLLFFTPNLYASDNSFTLKIGTMDLPPYGWIDQNGKPQGLIYELLEEVGSRSGVSYENRIYPFNRMLRLLEMGKIDILSSQAHEAAIQAGEKLAVQHNIDVIVGLKLGTGVTSLKELQGRHLIYHHGASYSQLNDIPKTITYVTSYEVAV